MIKKKILHVTKTYYPFSYGGIEKTIEIITRKKYRFFEHEIISTNSKNKNFNFIKNTRHKSFKRDLNILSSPFSFNLLKFLFEKKNSYNIIHFHYPWPFLNILIYFLDKKVKKVVTYHSDAISGYKIIDLLYFPFAFLFLSKMDIIIVTSRNYQKSSFLLNFFKKKIKIIHLSIDIPKKKIKKISFKKFVLFLGANRKYKGIDIIIEAANNLQAKFVLAGNFSKKDKKKFKKNKNISVINNPKEKEKNNLLKTCSLLVLPSTTRSEAFGLVLLEAAKYSKPVITTQLNTGTSFIVKNNYNGFIIEPNNAKQLKDKINILLNDKAKCKIMGKNNYIRLKKNFCSEQMLKNYNLIYE